MSRYSNKGSLSGRARTSVRGLRKTGVGSRERSEEVNKGGRCPGTFTVTLESTTHLKGHGVV